MTMACKFLHHYSSIRESAWFGYFDKMVARLQINLQIGKFRIQITTSICFTFPRRMVATYKSMDSLDNANADDANKSLTLHIKPQITSSEKQLLGLFFLLACLSSTWMCVTWIQSSSRSETEKCMKCPECGIVCEAIRQTVLCSYLIFDTVSANWIFCRPTWFLRCPSRLNGWVTQNRFNPGEVGMMMMTIMVPKW